MELDNQLSENDLSISEHNQYKLTLDEDICCICLDNDFDDKDILLVCCGNFIHGKCLFVVFLNNVFECPLCRGVCDPRLYFKIDDIYNYIDYFSNNDWQGVHLDICYNNIDSIIYNICSCLVLYTLHKTYIKFKLGGLRGMYLALKTFMTTVLMLACMILFYLLLYYVIITVVYLH